MMTDRDPESGLLATAQDEANARLPGDPPRPYPVDPIRTFSGRGEGEPLTDAQWHAQWADDHSESVKKTVEAVPDVVADGYTGPGSEHLPELAQALEEADQARAQRTAMEILLQAWPDKAEARNSVIVQAAMFQAGVIQAGLVAALDSIKPVRDILADSRLVASVVFYGGAAVVIISRILT